MADESKSCGGPAGPKVAGAITQVGIALVRHAGHFLVGRRGPSGTLAGLSEFPGGKCLPGETPAECAVRECREETGLEVEVLRLRLDLRHDFPYGTVHLYFYDCRLTAAAPLDPSAGFAWVSLHELANLNFPEPNRPLIQQLQRIT